MPPKLISKNLSNLIPNKNLVVNVGEETVLTKASVKGNSLRTTVPAGIVKLLDLKEGDKFKWELRADDGELLIVIKPIRRDKSAE